MLKLAEIYTSHMVLARDKVCIIWGESSEYGAEAYLNGKKVAETVFGCFEMKLPPQPAGGPHVLEITAGPERIVLEDVWFGEVWLAGGQSNMEYLLCNDGEYKKARESADIPMLRQFSVPKAKYKNYRNDHPDEFTVAPEWMISSPETCGQFSDLCFWYARKFIEEFKIPVGIVYCNYGGSSASAWVSRYTAAVNPVVHTFVEKYEQDLKGLTFTDYIKKYEDYYAYDRQWHEKAEELIRTEGLDAKTAYSDPRIGACPSWPPPNGPWHFSAPSHLYEGMLSTIIPYTLTQVLWYQGEEDVPYSDRYEQLLEAMIEEWRRDFRDTGLPFILIQIAPYSYDWNNCNKYDAAVIREADVALSHKLPSVSYVVTTDCGVQHDIHPPFKRVLGERILAQDKSRIDGSVPVRSPEVKTVTESSKSIESEACILVEFDQELAGNDEVQGVQLVDSTDSVYSVNARTFDKNKKLLYVPTGTSSEIKEIRYAYADYIESNLYGANGLPVTPFRKLL